MKFPDTIDTVEQLDEVLSRPSKALVQFMRKIEGDILILGAGGKIGPSLARLAKRAVDEAGSNIAVTAVDLMPLPALRPLGIRTIACDLLDPKAVNALPDSPNVIFMAGRKFGSTGGEHMTWAINVMVPHNVARIFTRSRIAVFSTGCVYPLMDVKTGGATEKTPPEPVGEYAQSCLGRERMFEYFSRVAGERVVQIRLNYSVELRYGVLFDVGWKIRNGEPVDVTTGHANVIWQGDACSQILRSLDLASTPPAALNVTGPETISIRETAHTFGRLLKKKVRIVGRENGKGYLSNASKAARLYGKPSVPPRRVIELIAHWLRIGGETLGKPTHFEVQNGKY